MQRFAKLSNPYFILITCLNRDILIFSQKILPHFKFDGKNMSQKSWDWDNKMLERFYIIQYHQKNQRMWRNLCVHGTILDSLWPLGPQETQALNTGIIVSWKSVHGGRNTSRKYYL